MDPAREVGGDLYDAFYAPDGVFCFLVGDVSGKGAAAGDVHGAHPQPRADGRRRAAAAAIGGGALAGLHRRGGEPRALPGQSRTHVRDAVSRIPRRAHRRADVHQRRPSGALPAARARRAPERSTASRRCRSPCAPAPDTRTETVTLEHGDALFACTDGVVEAMNDAGELYSPERLEAQLRAAIDAAPEAMVHAIKLDVDAFTGGAPKADDVTMLAVRRPPRRHALRCEGPMLRFFQARRSSSFATRSRNWRSSAKRWSASAASTASRRSRSFSSRSRWTRW